MSSRNARGSRSFCERSTRADPSVIGIDAFFAEEERILNPALVEDLRAYLKSDPEPRASALIERVLEEEEGDERLAQALAEGPYVLALHAGANLGLKKSRGDLTKATYGQLVAGERMPPAASRLLASLPRFHEAADRLGLATLVVGDDDQTARRLYVGRTFDGRVLVPFSVQLAAEKLAVTRGRMSYAASSHTLGLGDRRFFTDASHRLLINHRGGSEMFHIVSAAEVLGGEVDFKDAVVIVGFTELGQDTVRTPFTTHLPGAALHANVVSNLMRGDFLEEIPRSVGVALALLLVAVGSFFFSRAVPLSAIARAVILIGIALVYVAVAGLLFSTRDLVVPIASPVLAMLASGAAGLIVAYGREGIQRARLRQTFSRYLADDVIEEMMSPGNALTLGGEGRELTVLFSDIRGFTTLSEGLEPLELVNFLNAYLTPMTRAVLDNRGLLDKYIGDAIMAVFGAPVRTDDHANHALDAALAMHQTLTPLRESLVSILGPRAREIDAGVGINTGEMVVGNMGSFDRFDYTVIGDPVNLGARLEALTKLYGAFCVVGQATRARASDRFVFRELDTVRVVGKSEPVTLFELTASDRYTAATHHVLDRYRAGLKAYRAGDFAAADHELAAFLEENPGDKAATLLRTRMAEFGGRAPKDWDGTSRLTSK